jgi:hypothetical protein
MSQPIDLLIPAAPKDYHKLPFVMDLARQHLDVDEIHVVAPTELELDGAIVHLDADVLPYDREQMRFRPDWIFQQFVKLFQDVTASDWYLVLDADIFVVKRLPLWNKDGKPVLYLGRDQNHPPYFTFNQKMLGFGKVYDWSFLSECTLYSKALVRDMLAHCGLTRDEFWRKSAEIIGQGCCMADSELYGSYVKRCQPDVYEIRKLTAKLGGRYKSQPQWTDEEIRQEIAKVKRESPEVDIFSMHSWEGG